MEKSIRKAVKCYIVCGDKVVVTQYKSGNKKEGYYDIPGGKIEKGETPKMAAIREVREETGLRVEDLKERGELIVEYPDRKFLFTVFLTTQYDGELQEFPENTATWIPIEELLQKDKILSNIRILDPKYREYFLKEESFFTMEIIVKEDETILKEELMKMK